MNDAGWEITEMFGAWWVQVEGSFRESDEVLICEGLTNEEAMAIAAASGRVLVYADGRVFVYADGRWQKWGVPK